MRIGEWVPLYRRYLPIPQRMSMAFGLQEGSELYLARVIDNGTVDRFGCEVIVSPVPHKSWRNVCRLSVRLTDKPKALAIATRFLKQKRINILLTESCSTYQGRAHWDAICDLTETTGFDALAQTTRQTYEHEVSDFTAILSKQFAAFVEVPENSFAFTRGPAQHVSFSPLTGLNDASFICEKDVRKINHQGGAVVLPDDVIANISLECGLPGGTLPDYALVTGNTEQRYIRVLFMKDYDQMLQLTIDNDLRDFSGGGVGALNQVLEALPKDINLIRAANYIIEKDENIERGRIELIGHWHLPAIKGAAAKATYMEAQIRSIFRTMNLVDIEGNIHPAAMHVVQFASPRAVHPRVFVSYSTKHELEKLNYLLGALSANLFEPVLGTDFGTSSRDDFVQAGSGVSADVTQAAFEAIPGCLAFVSLQVRREDYRVSSPSGEARYVLPPWAIAEEVFAWSNRVPLVLRLKDAAIEDVTYNRNILTKQFASDAEYRVAVSEIINELNSFRRRSRAYSAANAEARERQFQPHYRPGN